MEAKIPDVVPATGPVEPEVLKVLVERFFEEMVKYVVDVERGIAAPLS